MVIKMKIYNWDEKTKFYTGSYDYIQPSFGKMTLVNATVTEPNIVRGKLCKWDGSKWITVDDVFNKICWDGEKFALYRFGDVIPNVARNITKDEEEKLNKASIYKWKNKDGQPEWESSKATDEDKEKKKLAMNKSCQNWILNKLGITALDEVLYPEKRQLADKLAQSESVDKQWNKYLKQIDKAKTLADLDFDFKFEI